MAALVMLGQLAEAIDRADGYGTTMTDTRAHGLKGATAPRCSETRAIVEAFRRLHG